MNCYKHPDKESSVNCSLCGEPICEECLVEIAGRPYCKDCVNKIVTQSIMEKSVGQAAANEVKAESPENIEAAPEVDTIEPIKEEMEAEAPASVAPQKQEKAPENFETDYEYETEYVETYDEGGEEDKYYENPEPSEPIVINPSSEEIEPEVPEEPDSNLEAKYERYLDDLYFDEPAPEPVRDTRRRRPQQYPADEQAAPRRGRRGRRQAQRDMDYVPQGQAYINQEYDDGLIIPAHSQQSQQYANESYEDLKRRIERNFAEEEEQRKRGLLRRSKKSNDGYNDLNIDNIQEMHNFKEEEDEGGLSVTEIILTVILIVLIIGVILYIVYLFTLSGDYASFQEAVMGLFSDPQTFLNNLMNFI